MNNQETIITTRVITFKKNGNEFKYSNKDLVKFSENVYLENTADEYGYKEVFFHHNGIYAYIDRLPEVYETEEQKARLESIASNLLNFYLNKRCISVVDLEFAKVAGFGYNELLARKKELQEEREQKRLTRDLERQRKEDELAAQISKGLKDSEERLLKDEYITYKELADLMDYKGFKIPIRTKGTILELGNLKIKNGTGYFSGKIRKSTEQNIFKLVSSFIDYIKN